MQTLSTLLILVSLVVIVLGLIGVIVGKVPWLKRRGRGLGAGVLVGGLALLILGGSLLPRRGIVVTASPATATILLDGKRYTGTTGTLPLVANSYEVEVSAPNHHPVKQTLDVSKQQRFNIALTPFTAEELAAIAERAGQVRLAKEAAARAEQQQVAAQAAAKKRADAAAAEASWKQAKAEAEQAKAAQQEADRQARLIDIGTFLIRCRDGVRAQLKSPDSAKSPGLMASDAQARETKDGQRVWGGWVEAENSFGAHPRTFFICTYSPATLETNVTLQ